MLSDQLQLIVLYCYNLVCLVMMCFDIGFYVDFGQYIVQATFTSFTLKLAE